jgi:hypothetical protein
MYPHHTASWMGGDSFSCIAPALLQAPHRTDGHNYDHQTQTSTWVDALIQAGCWCTTGVHALGWSSLIVSSTCGQGPMSAGLAALAFEDFAAGFLSGIGHALAWAACRSCSAEPAQVSGAAFDSRQIVANAAGGPCPECPCCAMPLSTWEDRKKHAMHMLNAWQIMATSLAT